VHETRLGADVLGEVGQKSDGLVMDVALDLADAIDIESAAQAYVSISSWMRK